MIKVNMGECVLKGGEDVLLAELGVCIVNEMEMLERKNFSKKEAVETVLKLVAESIKMFVASKKGLQNIITEIQVDINGLKEALEKEREERENG